MNSNSKDLLKNFFFLAISTVMLLSLSNCKMGSSSDDQKSSGKYPFETVENDPLNSRTYTLENGLKVFLTVYKDEPRIQTLVAVKAGSKFDPAETTGLAHYLEHMLFKGTHTMGTLNWEEEKVLLQKISDLYEAHKLEQDPEKKREIYKEIDAASFEASKLAIPNEYDKMINAIGAKSTNAYTSNDRTVYMNDIPSNELEKWLKIESERFQTLVLRLFHTELETVYEEFNRSQDRDSRWTFEAILAGLFPNHPYGTQSTIGVGEHLKNPSMVNIHNYFEKYYVPNNIAISLSGDLDPDQTIELIDKYFGDWQRKDIAEFTFVKDEMPASPKITNHYGPQEEHVYVGFGFDGASSADATMVKLVDGMLSNSQAGLIDLNLVQSQKTVEAYSFPFIRKDYSAHYLYGRPRSGQSLEEVKDLLLEQVELIKRGEFDDWLIEAVIKDLKLQEMRSYESNFSRAHAHVIAFTEGVEWKNKVAEWEKMSAITKSDISNFVKEHYGENYVVAYKHDGEDPNRHKVDKPEITPVVVNRDTQSVFFTAIEKMESDRLKPNFIDYDKDILKQKLKGDIDFNYVENKINETFSLSYIFDMGRANDKEIELAIKYLPLIGTDKYTAAELQKEFYRLGLTFDVYSGNKKINISLKGLEESFEPGLELFEHILSNVNPDQEAYDNMVENLLKKRKDAKLNKNTILRSALANYAKYGPNSLFTDILSEKELKEMSVDKLADKLKSLTNYKHRIFYYGQNSASDVKALLEKHHSLPSEWTPYPTERTYPELEMNSNKVYFVDYDMVQAEVMLLSKSQPYSQDVQTFSYVFNEYFGSGLSSIVFQEIREQKALAYSAYSVMRTPAYKEDSHYIQAYVGTQADKLKEAVAAMMELMNDMPRVDRQFEASKESAMKKIETDWVTRDAIYWDYERATDRGLKEDVRKGIYTDLEGIDFDQLNANFEKLIKGKNYTFIVIGAKDKVDMNVLADLGNLKQLTLEEIFNY